MKIKHGSLIIFTISIQAAVGLTMFAGAVGMSGGNVAFSRLMGISSALIVLGMIVSQSHLGQPMRAPRALWNIKTSWLSREIWVTGLLAGSSVLSVLVSVLPAFSAASPFMTLAAAIPIGKTNLDQFATGLNGRPLLAGYRDRWLAIHFRANSS